MKDEENENLTSKNKNGIMWQKRNLESIKMEGVVAVYNSHLMPIVKNKDKEQDEKTMDDALKRLLSSYIASLMKNMYALEYVLSKRRSGNGNDKKDKERITPNAWATLEEVTTLLLEFHTN